MVVKNPGPEGQALICPVVDPGFSRGKELGYYTGKFKVPE